MKRGRGNGKERKGKGEIGNGGVTPREKSLRAPMLQFISTKLVYNEYFVSNFTAFIFNSSLTKIVHTS